MKILISNDDGISSKGLAILAEVLQSKHDIYVVAPKEQQSAVSNSMTMHNPIYVEEAFLKNGIPCHAVHGTPADCVKVALHVVHKDVLFDFVISGINIGSNLGIDSIYSGTISAATEAALVGLKAIAISAPENRKHLFQNAAEFILEYLHELKEISFKKGTILNVNVPNLKRADIKGYMYGKQGQRFYKDVYIKRKSPRGKIYYWQESHIVERDDSDLADYRICDQGYISITPLSVDRTDYEALNKLMNKL